MTTDKGWKTATQRQRDTETFNDKKTSCPTPGGDVRVLLGIVLSPLVRVSSNDLSLVCSSAVLYRRSKVQNLPIWEVCNFLENLLTKLSHTFHWLVSVSKQPFTWKLKHAEALFGITSTTERIVARSLRWHLPDCKSTILVKAIFHFYKAVAVILHNMVGHKSETQKQNLTVKADLFIRQVRCERPI